MNKSSPLIWRPARWWTRRCRRARRRRRLYEAGRSFPATWGWGWPLGTETSPDCSFRKDHKLVIHSSYSPSVWWGYPRRSGFPRGHSSTWSSSLTFSRHRHVRAMSSWSNWKTTWSWTARSEDCTGTPLSDPDGSSDRTRAPTRIWRTPKWRILSEKKKKINN